MGSYKARRRERLSKRQLFDTDQADKNLIADSLLILIILLVTVGGLVAFHNESVLIGGGLAVTVVVVAEYVWSRTGKT